MFRRSICVAAASLRVSPRAKDAKQRSVPNATAAPRPSAVPHLVDDVPRQAIKSKRDLKQPWARTIQGWALRGAFGLHPATLRLQLQRQYGAAAVAHVTVADVRRVARIATKQRKGNKKQKAKAEDAAAVVPDPRVRQRDAFQWMEATELSGSRQDVAVVTARSGVNCSPRDLVKRVTALTLDTGTRCTVCGLGDVTLERSNAFSGAAMPSPWGVAFAEKRTTRDIGDGGSGGALTMRVESGTTVWDSGLWYLARPQTVLSLTVDGEAVNVTRGIDALQKQIDAASTLRCTLQTHDGVAQRLVRRAAPSPLHRGVRMEVVHCAQKGKWFWARARFSLDASVGTRAPGVDEGARGLDWLPPNSGTAVGPRRRALPVFQLSTAQVDVVRAMESAIAQRSGVASKRSRATRLFAVSRLFGTSAKIAERGGFTKSTLKHDPAALRRAVDYVIAGKGTRGKSSSSSSKSSSSNDRLRDTVVVEGFFVRATQ